jgi:hypothetical protein
MYSIISTDGHVQRGGGDVLRHQRGGPFDDASLGRVAINSKARAPIWTYRCRITNQVAAGNCSGFDVGRFLGAQRYAICSLNCGPIWEQREARVFP